VPVRLSTTLPNCSVTVTASTWSKIERHGRRELPVDIDPGTSATEIGLGNRGVARILVGLDRCVSILAGRDGRGVGRVSGGVGGSGEVSSLDRRRLRPQRRPFGLGCRGLSGRCGLLGSRRGGCRVAG
jgi:hypothetical protein